MPSRTYNVLFLCKGNSARSIIAEAYLNSLHSHLHGFSAGAEPRGLIHPLALDVLHNLKLPTDGLRSKSWDEFASPAAPVMDLIINLCDEPAGEECPTWPEQPVSAHWGIPDPAIVEGSEVNKHQAFFRTVGYLRRRIDILVNFRMKHLDRITIKRLDDMGKRQADEFDELEAPG